MSLGRSGVRAAVGGLGCLVLWFVLSSPSSAPPRPQAVAVVDPGPSAVAPADTTTEPAELNLVELRAGMASFVGRPVRVVGFSRSGGRIPAGRLLLYRYRLRCCAADQVEPVPVAVFVEPPAGTSEPPQEAWIEVEGVPAWEVQGGLRVPVVRASALRQLPQPSDTCLH